MKSAKNLIDLIEQFDNGKRHDNQILDILVGMGINKETALLGISEYNEYKSAGIKNESNRSFNILSLYEQLSKTIKSLNEILNESNTINYSVNILNEKLKQYLLKFPFDIKKYSLNEADDYVENDPLFKYYIAESLHETIQNYKWLTPVKELFSFIENNITENYWSYKIAKVINEHCNKTDAVSVMMTEKLKDLIDKPNEFIENKFGYIIESNKWFTPLHSIMNEMISSNNNYEAVSDVDVSHPVSPILKMDEGYIFHLRGKNYLLDKNNNIKETLVNDSRFNSIVEGLGLFTYTGKNFILYGENNNIFKFNPDTKSIKLNENDLSNKTLDQIRESLILNKLFDSNNFIKYNTVCNFLANSDMIYEMDNALNVKSKNLINYFLTVIGVDEGVWINKYSYNDRINEMKYFSTLNDAINESKEFIGYDISKFLEEGLDLGDVRKEELELEEKRNTLKSDIDFLYKKKNDTLTKIQEIGEDYPKQLDEALSIIDNQIKECECELQKTYEKNDDEEYVKGELVSNEGSLKKGEEVHIHALDFSSSGKSDKVKVMDKDEKFHKVTKKKLRITDEDMDD